MTPKVWNKRDRRCPANSVYVGRPTKWGNPWSHLPSRLDASIIRVDTREDAIERYLLWITSDDKTAVQLRADAVRELRGRHLTCWCAPHDCHAEILLQIAND